MIWWWIRWTHSLADLTLVTSTALQEQFQAHHQMNMTPRSVQVWEKGIDTERFHPRHASKEMRRRLIMGSSSSSSMDHHRNDEDANHNDDLDDQEEDDVVVLLYVGRLAAEKQLLILQPVLEQLQLLSNNATRLCFVGTGPQEDVLKKKFAASSSTTTTTTFLGELHGEELSQAYASADIFVFPSDSETLGFVAMEAMASGLPVVGANAGGIPNMIDHGHTGYLVDDYKNEANSDEYVSRIHELQTNATKRNEMGVLARRATEEWSWEASMSNLLHVQYPQARANYERRWSVRLWRRLFGHRRKWNTQVERITDKKPTN
jgi:sulfoquinovosyltransferase